MDLSINLKIGKKIKIYTQIHTQKLKIFVCILNYLIRYSGLSFSLGKQKPKPKLNIQKIGS